MDPVYGENFTTTGREIAHHAAYHRPKAYRYKVADRGFRIVRNRYANRFGSATIGAAIVIGRYAYCIKWADARIRFR